MVVAGGSLGRALTSAATQRAWTTCVLMLLTALVIDSRWGGHLPVLVAISLLCAMLTQQYSLARSARAAMPVDE